MFQRHMTQGVDWFKENGDKFNQEFKTQLNASMHSSEVNASDGYGGEDSEDMWSSLSRRLSLSGVDLSNLVVDKAPHFPLF